MINYVEKEEYTTIVYYKDGKKIKSIKSFSYVLNDLCVAYFSSLNGRIEAIKRKFNFQRKIPILVSNSILLLPIKSYRCENPLYINYFEIKDIKYEKNFIIVIFNDKTRINLSKNINIDLILFRGRIISEELKKMKIKENVFI